MATTLEATATSYDVRLRALSDLPDGTLIEVTRTMRYGLPNPATGRVRGPLTLEGGAWVVADIEVLFNTPIFYSLIARDAVTKAILDTAEAGPVTITNPNAIIRSVLARGTRALARIVGQESGDYKSETRRELLRPLGRKSPVVITDVRSAAAGSTTFLTMSVAEAKSMNNVLGSGDVLMFTGPSDWDIRWPLYLSFGDVTVKRVGESLSENRLWACDWVEVDPPPSTLFEAVPATTWQMLLDADQQWLDIRHTSWIDVLYPLTDFVVRAA